jgi:hypothetical protein
MWKWVISIVIAIIIFLTKRAKKVAAFVNMTVDGVDLKEPGDGTFVSNNMEIEYGDGWSEQFGTKLARNSAYNYNQVHSRWFERLVIGESFSFSEEKDYDTVRVWDGAVIFVTGMHAAFLEVPKFQTGIPQCHKIITLTTSYQTFVSDGWASDNVIDFDIKALAGGGFRIRNNILSSVTLTAFVEKCRLIAGS